MEGNSADDLPRERRDLIQHVFADASCLIEMAHAFATTGQAPDLAPAEYRCCARRLATAARKVLVLAAALPVLICPSLSDDGANDDGP